MKKYVAGYDPKQDFDELNRRYAVIGKLYDTLAKIGIPINMDIYLELCDLWEDSYVNGNG